MIPNSFKIKDMAILRTPERWIQKNQKVPTDMVFSLNFWDSLPSLLHGALVECGALWLKMTPHTAN